MNSKRGIEIEGDGPWYPLKSCALTEKINRILVTHIDAWCTFLLFIFSGGGGGEQINELGEQNEIYFDKKQQQPLLNWP